MATLKDPGKLTFNGVLKKDESIDFPYDLKETYGKGNLVPVKITFDDRVVYVGSLAKRGGPYAMVLLRKDIRAQLNKNPGDAVKVCVELDTSKRSVELQRDEKEALAKAGLLEKFQKLAFTHQREYHTWIEEAKRPETRTNRIKKMCEILGG